MTTQVSALRKDVDKLTRDVQRIKEVLNILPPVVKPLDWKELHRLDRAVLAYMMDHERQASFTTGEIAQALGLPKESGRVRVWKSLKRIRRVARAKHKCILYQDKIAKTWSLRRSDYTFSNTLRSSR